MSEKEINDIIHKKLFEKAEKVREGVKKDPIDKLIELAEFDGDTKAMTFTLPIEILEFLSFMKMKLKKKGVTQKDMVVAGVVLVGAHLWNELDDATKNYIESAMPTLVKKIQKINEKF